MLCYGYNNLGKTDQGFALVAALSLMAFVLVIVLSITALVQVEIRQSQTNLQTLKARESAQLALMMAIGQLQEHAGHDQRITARADIMGDESIHATARFWTGVWDSTDMDQPPVWLVTGTNVNTEVEPSNSMQLVGTGTAGDNPSQFVFVPAIEMFNENGSLSKRLGWWISDENIKASIACLPLNHRPTPSFLGEDNGLQLQTASTHGLESIFDQYDQFSSNDALLLDRVSIIEQLKLLTDFEGGFTSDSNDALFHSLTSHSQGVLADTKNGGLMQDLSLFPALLGTGLERYLQLAEEHADQLASQESKLAKKQLVTEIIGLDEIGTLNDGDIATPIIPVLSNFMIAFTIRRKEKATNDDNFLLRARFFCEFWNPFTHTLSMTDEDGEPIDLKLELTGLPEVTVHNNSGGKSPIDLQALMKDQKNKNDAVVIYLISNPNHPSEPTEPWLPGRSKNWVGFDQKPSDPIHSPYKSTDIKTKQWGLNDKTLGGTEGLDTGLKGFSGDIRHESNGQHTLRINVYLVKESSEHLISTLDGFLYEPVSTSNPEDSKLYSNKHKNMTFGYHIMLREPCHSNKESEFYRGQWLKDHDPRNPEPFFPDDWHLDNSEDKKTGSPYVPVVDGKTPLTLPEPQLINQFSSAINFVDTERLLDRSKNHLDTLWQDAPVFELPRRRMLSLASMQHIYIHSERPFQVGNSWGDQGKYNTSSWFDRYYFSGLNRKDDLSSFETHTGSGHPCLQLSDADNFPAQLELWKQKENDDPIAAREPAKHLMVANQFNINSTSIDAWKAVLSSLRIDNFQHLHWPEEDTSDPGTLDLIATSRNQGNFTRFSHSLEETYQVTAPPTELDNKPVAPSAFYRHGARRFKNEDFDAFAREIVRLIKQQSRPFESMEAFLSELSTGNGSLLEQAIRNTLTNPETKRQEWYHRWETKGEDLEIETPVEIDHFAPGFLTQADIMTAIGPMLAPRSDTFKIRARAECFDDFGNPISVAVVEAILQRTPEAKDSTTPLNMPTTRKWKICSVRWLSENEL